MPTPQCKALYEKVKNNKELDYTETILLFFIIESEGKRQSSIDSSHDFLWRFSIGANVLANIQEYFNKPKENIMALYNEKMLNDNSIKGETISNGFDDTINAALEKLEVCFKSQDKAGIIEIGKNLYGVNGSMFMMHTVGERFARKFPRDAGTLNFLWNGIGEWKA